MVRTILKSDSEKRGILSRVRGLPAYMKKADAERDQSYVIPEPIVRFEKLSLLNQPKTFQGMVP